MSRSFYAVVLCWMGLLAACGVGPAMGQLVISEVDLVGNQVELYNRGTNDVDISTWWWCNRVNGSPFYNTVAAASTIDTNLSSATSLDVMPGEVLVLTLTAGFLPDGSGELGLYTVNSFGSSTAIRDYIAWNSTGIRDTPASQAGIWILDESVSTAGVMPGETIQLQPFDLAGNAAAEYDFAPGTLGVAQSIPPTITQVEVADTTLLRFPTQSGAVYRLEATPDLVDTNYTDLGLSLIGNGETNYFFDPGTPAGVSTSRFYRITVSP